MTLSIRAIGRFMPVLGALAVLATSSPAASAPAPGPASNFADVDPLIGTGPDGHTFPGATVPFGMVQLSPDTQIRPFKQSYKWAAGYRYEDSTILGFSHTHFSGSGHSDLGDILLQPIAGDVQLEPGDPAHQAGHRLPLPLLPRARAGPPRLLRRRPPRLQHPRRAHRHPPRRPAPLHLPRRASQPHTSSSTSAPPSTTTPARSSGRASASAPTAPSPACAKPAAGLPAASFTSPSASRNPSPATTSTTASPPRRVPRLQNPRQHPRGHPSHRRPRPPRHLRLRPARPLVVEVALSPVSEDAALANMQAEAPAFDFDAAHAAATAAWEKQFAALDLTAPPDLQNRSTPPSTTPSSRPTSPWTPTAATAAPTTRSTTPRTSTSSPTSRSGTPTAPSSRS